MEEEYQGAPYATVLPQSSNAVDNFLAYSQKQKSDALAEQKLAEREALAKQNRINVLSKYFNSTLGAKDFQSNTGTLYDDVYNHDLGQVRQQTQQLIENDADSPTIQNFINQRTQQILDKRNNVQATVNNINKSANAMKIPGLNVDELKNIAIQNALYTKDPKTGKLQMKSDADMAQLDPTHDHFLDALNGSADQMKTDITVPQLERMEGKRQLPIKATYKNADGKMMQTEMNATIIPTITAYDPKAQKVSVVGASPLIGNNRLPITYDGKPLMQFTPEQRAVIRAKYPTMPFAVQKAMLHLNKDRMADGLSPLDPESEMYHEMSDNIMYNKIAPFALDPITTENKNLSDLMKEKMENAIQMHQANRNYDVKHPIGTTTSKDPWDASRRQDVMNTISANRRDAQQILAGTKKGFDDLDQDLQNKLRAGAKKFMSMSGEERINYYRNTDNGGLPDVAVPSSIFEQAEDVQNTTPTVEPPKKPTIVDSVRNFGKKLFPPKPKPNPSNIDFNQFKRK